ncbi:MAG: ATP-dependent DNA helicase RecG [Deltaproteobacteria bacterium]|nr:ATP-dependent DNA helicase RecG [Deltaproteobacteria bacterium]
MLRAVVAVAPAADGTDGGVLMAPVSTLPGAGPVTAARLLAHGLVTVGDVLSYVPRAYDDLRILTPLASLVEKPEGAVVLVRGTVARVNVFPRRFLAVTIEEDGARLVARWFRVPGGMARAFEKGSQVVLAGPLRFGTDGQLELLHPTNLTTSAAAGLPGMGLGIRPRYPTIPGVAARVLERIVGAAVDRHVDDVPDVLPAATRARLCLPSIAEALRLIHRPDHQSTAAVLDALVAARSEAHRRLAVEDLLIIQMGLARRRVSARSLSGRPCEAPEADVFDQVSRALPFGLTKAQAKAIAEIQRDMVGGRPMQRLLVGDVGSGKTAVAFAAAAQAGLSGGQTLLMAPTEILAEQHARTLEPLAKRLGLRVALLTASTPRPRRESLLALARAGQVAIIVGTQALLADRVSLPGLRLAIVDEQHRFGVAQRARLRGRDDADTGTNPHLLVMTATPIPRTLAFTLYGDLDLSVLDEMPPGRKPVVTRVLKGTSARAEAEAEMRAAVAAGRRVFVVCPVREFSAREGGVTAIDRHRELEKSMESARVGLVHGDMDARTKDGALRAFAAGDLDVLVATTVIEVGIDVPEASLMVVEEADRFGLAQLHQLRGRVGRGADASTCLLLMGNSAGISSGADGNDAAQRLSVIASTNDGFRIAEADLELRGCGDLFGVKQAGMPRLRFPDLASMGKLLELARTEATRIMDVDPSLAADDHQALRAAVDARWNAAEIFGEEAG